jgi:hypothetical protein
MPLTVKDGTGANQSIKTWSDVAKVQNAVAEATPDGPTLQLVRRDNPAQSLVGADGRYVALGGDSKGRARISAEAALLRTTTVNIASGAALSPEVALNGGRLVGIQMPDAWTPAQLSFQVAPAPGGVFRNLYDALGQEVRVAADASRHILFLLDDLFGVPALIIRSGTALTPVNQAAVRALTLIISD